MVLNVARPIGIAAIDAGSNGIRALVARVSGAAEIHPLASERWPVRLGHRVFTHRRFDRPTIARAVETFRHFRALLERYNVREYRAVATSAVREATNRDALLRRILRETGIRLEVIDSTEESRLVRSAVLEALAGRIAPRLILDLGGGSLEVSMLRGGRIDRTLALPLGAVRLMETFGLTGALTEDRLNSLSHYVRSMLRSLWRQPPDLSAEVIASCGGNAEALARLCPGPRMAGLNTLNLRLLREQLWQMARLDVRDRMKAFGVRRDRAEVMVVAAVVLTTLAEWIRPGAVVVPGVGVREGILRDLTIEHFGPSDLDDERARVLLEQVRLFAARLQCEQAHAEHVRGLAASLFDQLAPVHKLTGEMRLPLEMAALLHDVGLVINAKSHHRHGEYLVRNAHIPGLPSYLQALVACLVRYHSKAGPEPHHKLYASLGARDRRRVRALSALLRIAVGLDAEGTQAVRQVESRVARKAVHLEVRVSSNGEVNFWRAREKARLFEKAFGKKVYFARSQRGGDAAAPRHRTGPARPSQAQRRAGESLHNPAA